MKSAFLALGLAGILSSSKPLNSIENLFDKNSVFLFEDYAKHYYSSSFVIRKHSNEIKGALCLFDFNGDNMPDIRGYFKKKSAYISHDSIAVKTEKTAKYLFVNDGKNKSSEYVLSDEDGDGTLEDRKAPEEWRKKHPEFVGDFYLW